MSKLLVGVKVKINSNSPYSLTYGMDGTGTIQEVVEFGDGKSMYEIKMNNGPDNETGTWPFFANEIDVIEGNSGKVSDYTYAHTLDSLAPHGATHYEVEQKGISRKAGYMRLNQEGLWYFWSIHEERWFEDHQVNHGYVKTNKLIKLHVSVS